MRRTPHTPSYKSAGSSLLSPSTLKEVLYFHHERERRFAFLTKKSYIFFDMVFSGF